MKLYECRYKTRAKEQISTTNHRALTITWQKNTLHQGTHAHETTAGLAPKIGCSGWKRRLQTVTYTPNLVDRDPEGVSSRLRCICAWGGAPSPLAPRSRGHPLKKSTKTHTRALCNRGRRTHLRVAALPAASRASICSFASCPLDAVSSGAAAAAHC